MWCELGAFCVAYLTQTGSNTALMIIFVFVMSLKSSLQVNLGKLLRRGHVGAT